MLEMKQVAVSSTAIELVSADDNEYRHVLVRFGSATETFTLGTSNAVTASNGFSLDLDTPSETFTLGPGEALWGISSLTGAVAHILVSSAS